MSKEVLNGIHERLCDQERNSDMFRPKLQLDDQTRRGSIWRRLAKEVLAKLE